MKYKVSNVIPTIKRSPRNDVIFNMSPLGSCMSETKLIPLKMKVCFPKSVGREELQEIQRQLQRAFSLYSVSPLRENDRDGGSHFFCDGFYGGEIERVIEHGDKRE